MAVFEWKPQGKRPCGCLRKRWIAGVAEDLSAMGIGNLHEDKHKIVHDREKWLDIVVTAKIHRE